MNDLFEKCQGDGGYFGQLRAARDSYITQPILDSLPGPHMEFAGKPVIMWSVNNYLGLAGNKRLHAAAVASAQANGTSHPMGSRLLTGNTTKHRALEAELAEFSGKEAAVLFNYGYLGVIGTISALIGPHDVVIIDKLSHASMIDGAMLAMAGRRFRPFKHNSMESLERQLQASSKGKGGALVVVEGVYGMRGDLAKLPEICALKNRYGARLFVDDAHGFGVMGSTGQGTGQHFGVQDEIDLYFGTFAKAFAGIGGVTAGAEPVMEYVRYNARSNVFAKSLPMIYVDTLRATLAEIIEHPEYRARMWEVARTLQAGLRDLGFHIGDTESPVTPVYMPTNDAEGGMRILRALREKHGVFLSGVTYPVTPKGIHLFRLIPTAAHSDDDVATTLAAFAKIRRDFNLDQTEGWERQAV